MFCAGCGKDLTEETGNFCPKCGARKATQQNSVNPQYNIYPKTQSGMGMAGRQLVGIVLAIIGLILFIVGIVMFNSGEQQFARAVGYNSPETDTPILIMGFGVIALIIGVVMALLKASINNNSSAGVTGIASGLNYENTQHNEQPIPQAGKGKAMASLVMGIAGLATGLGIIAGPVGMYLAISAKNEGVKDGIQKAGWICSIVATVVGVIYIICMISTIAILS